MKHYDSVSEFTDGFATVTIGDKCGIIDSDYNEITDIKYDTVIEYHDLKNIKCISYDQIEEACRKTFRKML